MDTTRCTITSDYHSLTREAIVKLLEQRDAELEQRDAELKVKDAELERKSRRILELERMVFGRRSEKRLPENASDWTGTLFDEQWAKEGSLAQVEALPIIKEIKQQVITPCDPSFQKGNGLRLLCSREHRATGDGDISRGL